MIIGITGPIASGKDEVVNILSEILNSNPPFNLFNNITAIIDADKIGKFVVENNFSKISCIFNVKNFTELSNLVFSDFLIFSKYNSFIHPILSSRLREILINQKKENKRESQEYFNEYDKKYNSKYDNEYDDKYNNKYDNIILVNCALLYLLRLDLFCDKIIFIDSEKDVRINRLINRNNIEIKDAEKRVFFQEKVENYETIRKFFKIKNTDKFYESPTSIFENITTLQYKQKIFYLKNDEDLVKLKEKLKKIVQIILARR
jgi:dephospho-CoA kinase